MRRKSLRAHVPTGKAGTRGRGRSVCFACSPRRCAASARLPLRLRTLLRLLLRSRRLLCASLWHCLLWQRPRLVKRRRRWRQQGCCLPCRRAAARSRQAATAAVACCTAQQAQPAHIAADGGCQPLGPLGRLGTGHNRSVYQGVKRWVGGAGAQAQAAMQCGGAPHQHGRAAACMGTPAVLAWLSLTSTRYVRKPT